MFDVAQRGQASVTLQPDSGLFNSFGAGVVKLTVYKCLGTDHLISKGRMQKGRLTNPQISLVLGLVSPGIKVGMLKAVLSADLLILVLKSGPRPCLHKM